MLYYFLSSPKEIRKFSQNFRLKTWEDEPNHKPLNSSGYKPQIRALELHSRAAPSVEAHYRVSGPNTGRNSGEKADKKIRNRNSSKKYTFCKTRHF